jgi:membrane protein DedA with SNARE-associated domain
VLAFGYAGKAAGSDWTNIKSGFEYVDYVVVAAVVIGIAYLVVRRRRRVATDIAS